MTFHIHKASILAGCVFAGLTFQPVLAVGQEDVVARVNGEVLTTADVAMAAEIYGDQLAGAPEEARRSAIVDVLIDMRIAADAARAEGIEEEDGFRRQMAFLRNQTLRALFLEQRVAEAVSDEAVRKAYDEKISEVPPVEEVRLRHILLSTEQEAEDVVAALDNGADFAALASERSKDEASRNAGGDLGFVTVGQTIAAVDEAAAELAPGEYTASPVKSAFGFHVVEVEERRNRPAPSFETVAPQIRRALESAAAQRIMNELRTEAKVEKLVPDVPLPQADDGHNHGPAGAQE
ncbi:peptidylprolyl isomerase [Chelativorans intermedius]|uniref:Parvulin-like PPIase n=1 Tax=Chelativorans intermedius TaxID=515947 RepID=A0ABV6DCR2_9HYPH|nr:peptidylprolyl isomerase [Chelativorans intermedius]MCT9000477.1 peptidylprolyl isomerase [Chelativorans intermedius]